MKTELTKRQVQHRLKVLNQLRKIAKDATPEAQVTYMLDIINHSNLILTTKK